MAEQTASKVPRIRFKGFEVEWEPRELGEITTKIGSGKTPRGGKTGYLSIGIPLIRSQNIFNDSVNFEGIAFISDETDAEMSNSRVLQNDVLLNITGASIGRSAVYRSGERANVNQHVCIVRANGKHHFDFIQLNLASTRGQAAIDNSQAGGAREGLNFQQIAKFGFQFPSLTEQTKIGGYFRELDRLIELHQRKHDKLVTLNKSMLQKMFPQPGAITPEIRFKGFSGDWIEKALGDIIDLGSGRDYKHLSHGNIPVYGTGGYMLSVNEALSTSIDAVGIGRKGTIDKPYILKAPFWTVDTLFYAIPIAENYLDFVFCIFQRIDWKQKDESTGVPSLSKVAINGVSVLSTNPPEQQKIGSYFRTLDELISKHAIQLQKLKQIKSACLEKMFV